MERHGSGSEIEIVVGREPELDDLTAWISGSRRERALIISGPPGVGKTTLWQAATAAAAHAGMRVLSARAGEAETRFPFAVLADLLDDVDLGSVRSIPAPQLSAVGAAILRVAPVGDRSEPRAVALGLLSILRSLALDRPILIAIDDLQWADPESIEALSFAIRRLPDELRVLVARRPGGANPLGRAFGPPETRTLTIEGLSLGAMRRLLDARLAVPLPRRIAAQLHEATLGNPLFALEVGRALAAGVAPEAGADLPLPDSLDELLWARASAVPGAGEALLAVALGGALTSLELATLVGEAAIDAALAAGLLVEEHQRLRLWHPLVATSVLRRTSPAQRRSLHARLGEVTSDLVRRARHLALAAVRPDPTLADLISEGAASASARGALAPAIELAEHGLRLTPAGHPDREARVLLLGELLNQLEEGQRLRDLMAQEFQHLSPGEHLAHGHLLLSHVAQTQEEYDEHLQAAVREAVASPAIRSQALAAQSADLAIAYLERLDEAETKAAEALVIAPDPASRAEAVHALGWTRILRGRPVDDLGSLVRAGDTGVDMAASFERVHAIRLAFRGELEAARMIFQHELARAEDHGHVEARGQFLLQLCELELRAGRLGVVDELLAARDLQEGSFRIGTRAVDARLLAMASAIRGDHVAAEHHGARALSLIYGQRWDLLEVHRARGIAALAARQMALACEQLGSVWRHTEVETIHDPGAFPVAADLVEAALATGDEILARDVTTRLAERAREQQHPGVSRLPGAARRPSRWPPAPISAGRGQACLTR